jgi:hypothetical protein
MKKIYLPIIIIIAVLVAGAIYYTAKNSNLASVQPVISGLEENISREEIFVDFPNKIADISPTKPVLGGNWYINRFWFIQDSNEDFYAEYEDGHIMARILIEAGRNNSGLNYKVVAYFEPGENDWVLKQGEDKFFGEPLDLYEHSEDLGKWVKKN